MTDRQNSLKSKTIFGLVWSFLDKFFVRAITFIIGIILARLLTPAEFGLIGMITIFISISQIFINSGFKEALIRRKHVTENDYNTVFIFNIVTSVILYLIIYFSAGYIAEFYAEPQLTILIRVLAISLFFNALTVVQSTKITKKIDFKTLTKVSVISSIISGIVGVVLALTGYGVWSLIFKEITQSFIIMILLHFFSRWTPNFHFSKDSFRELFSFGSNLMINAIIGTFFKNVYLLVIGKYYSAALLGQYTRAETFKRLPSNTISEIVNRVTYPVLAEVQEDKDKLKMIYKRLIKSTMLISIFGMFLLSVISEELVVVLIGEKWSTAGYYLKILCFSGLFYPLDALNTNILKIMNRSDLILKIGLLRKALAIPLIFVIIYVGIEPFLYLLILHQIISFLLISNYSKSYIGYGSLDQIKDVLPFLLIGMAMYALIYIFQLNVHLGPMINLLLQSVIALVFIVITCEIFAIEAYKYLKELILSKKSTLHES